MNIKNINLIYESKGGILLTEIHLIIASMQGITGPKRDIIIKRQLSHFFKANKELGAGVAKGLGINISKEELEPAV